MRLIIIVVLICFSACSSNQNKVIASKEVNKSSDTLAMHSCFTRLYIDKTSIESKTFRTFWNSAAKQGYTFTDDTTVPFTKVIFLPKSVEFYTDSLGINNCKVFDSVNIHKIEIRSPHKAGEYTYSNLNIEEWEFKDTSTAFSYAKALVENLNTGYGVKSPTNVLLFNHSVYIFQTAAYSFIPEMERMEKLLCSNPNILGSNY